MTGNKKKHHEVIIIDDNEMHCRGVKSNFLSSKLPVTVAGIFYRGEKALEWLKTHSADIALVDYYMPGLHGLELITRLKTNFPAMKLIMITSETNPYLLRQVLETETLHALLIKGAIDLLPNAIRAAIEDKTYLQPEWGISIYKAELDSKKLITLTEKQLECLKLTVQGKSAEEIAHLQNTTPNTVKDRQVQCRKKLDEKSTENLIKHYKIFFPVDEETSGGASQIAQYVPVGETLEQEEAPINYDAFLINYNNDQEVVEKLFRGFLEEIDGQVQDFIEAYKNQDWEKLRAQNDKLLGSNCILKTERLGMYCEQLREEIHKGDTELISQSVKAILKEVQAVKKYMHEKLGS